MKLGFIGTGKIASSVITGICNSKISFTKILISPRNKLIANFLKKNPDPDDLIITGTKITNTGHFLVEWIIKSPIFH